VSVITEAELRTGAARSTSPVKTLHLVENFVGTPIGPLATLVPGPVGGENASVLTATGTLGTR
jgi:hypothetical protein